MLRRNPRNLVLDSVFPELAPHIVITPPDAADWEDLVVMRENGAPSQSPEYLTVPLPNGGLSSYSSLGLPIAEHEQTFECCDADDGEVLSVKQHLRRFSPSRFSLMVLSCHLRLTVSHTPLVNPSSLKHLKNDLVCTISCQRSITVSIAYV